MSFREFLLYGGLLSRDCHTPFDPRASVNRRQAIDNFQDCFLGWLLPVIQSSPHARWAWRVSLFAAQWQGVACGGFSAVNEEEEFLPLLLPQALIPHQDPPLHTPPLPYVRLLLACIPFSFDHGYVHLRPVRLPHLHRLRTPPLLSPTNVLSFLSTSRGKLRAVRIGSLEKFGQLQKKLRETQCSRCT